MLAKRRNTVARCCAACWVAALWLHHNAQRSHCRAGLVLRQPQQAPPTLPHPTPTPLLHTHLVVVQEGLDLAAEGAHVVLVHNDLPGQPAGHVGGPLIPLLGLQGGGGSGGNMCAKGAFFRGPRAGLGTWARMPGARQEGGGARLIACPAGSALGPCCLCWLAFGRPCPAPDALSPSRLPCPSPTARAPRPVPPLG